MGQNCVALGANSVEERPAQRMRPDHTVGSAQRSRTRERQQSGRAPSVKPGPAARSHGSGPAPPRRVGAGSPAHAPAAAKSRTGGAVTPLSTGRRRAFVGSFPLIPLHPLAGVASFSSAGSIYLIRGWRPRGDPFDEGPVCARALGATPTSRPPVPLRHRDCASDKAIPESIRRRSRSQSS